MKNNNKQKENYTSPDIYLLACKENIILTSGFMDATDWDIQKEVPEDGLFIN